MAISLISDLVAFWFPYGRAIRNLVIVVVVDTAMIFDVLIVGAGPVGIFLACEPCLGGASVLLLEKNERSSIPKAKATVTNRDTGLSLQGNSDASGVYVFSPIKIGNYEISVTAPGFQTTTQQNVRLDI